MDELTAKILGDLDAAKEAKKRGYPFITCKCWDCKKEYQMNAEVVGLSEWLKWEAEGRKVMSGICPDCDISDNKEDED